MPAEEMIMSPMRAELTTASAPDAQLNYAEQRLNFSSTFVTGSNSFIMVTFREVIFQIFNLTTGF